MQLQDSRCRLVRGRVRLIGTGSAVRTITSPLSQEQVFGVSSLGRAGRYGVVNVGLSRR
ncbi:hypothetical protein BVI1335_350045 [Burkholderia vietnamiensis]|nr:hypothetical protein BVI1335_350045 [Burkholderia vietnamiensis]